MPTNLRQEKGKLKLHKRSHVSGKRFSFRGHLEFADRLAKQAKKLGKALKYTPGE